MDVKQAQAITLDAWKRHNPIIFSQAVALAVKRKGGKTGFGDLGDTTTDTSSGVGIFDDIMGTLSDTYATVKDANTAAAVQQSQVAANQGVVRAPGLSAINWPLIGGGIGLIVLVALLVRGRRRK